MLPERCRVIGVSLFRLNFRLYLLHNPIISHHEELFVARDSPEPIQSSNGRCRIGNVWHIKVLNYSMVDAATRIHVSESRSCDCCWLQTQMWYIDSCHSGSSSPPTPRRCSIIVCNQITFPPRTFRLFFLHFSRHPLRSRFRNILGVCFTFFLAFRFVFLHQEARMEKSYECFKVCLLAL